MSASDHNAWTDAENRHGADGERVVVRDRRRVDPVTGEVRVPGGASSPSGPGTARSDPAESSGLDAADSALDVAATDSAAGVTAAELADTAAELAEQVTERTADLQRVSAEYANYRRRVDRDREAVLVMARVQFVAELLTVLDDLDRAEAHGDLTGAFKAVADKVVGVVQKLGLEAFGVEREPFDPSVHEAVHHDTTEADGPTVAVVSAVLRRGYRIADRVLRPAMVTVVDRTAPPDSVAPPDIAPPDVAGPDVAGPDVAGPDVVEEPGGPTQDERI